MTKREDLHVVKPATTVNQALEILVEKRITGFPVIDDEWKLVGLDSCVGLRFISAGLSLRIFPRYYLVLEDRIQTCFLKLTALGKHSMNYKSCLAKPTEKWSVI